jgi:hypothetical protein
MASQEDNLQADWDPLQGGYQAIVDICNEACSKVASRASRPDIFEPERASALNKTSSNMEQNSAQAGMPPPQRFNRRSRNPFVG